MFLKFCSKKTKIAKKKKKKTNKLGAETIVFKIYLY